MDRQHEQLWQENIASGVVLKMAQTYENQGQLTKALLLYIQQLKAGAFGSEAIRLFKALKRLQNALGEEQFRQICQATDFPPEELLTLMTFMNPSLTSNANLEQQSEYFEVEHLPEPDKEFQQVWQDFFQSFQERLATAFISSTDESSAESQQVHQEIRQTWQDFIQAAQNSLTSDATSNTASSGLNFQQAWETLEQSVHRLKEKYSPRQRLFDDDFEHLHLPPGSPLSRPDWSQETQEKELQEKEQAIREKNLYAFFRYLRTFKNHSAPVYSIIFSSNGQTLVSGSADNTIKLWNLSTCQEIHTLTGHTSAVISLAMSPDGTVLASGSADNTIKLWNASTGQEIYTLTGHADSVLCIAINPSQQVLASGSADNTIKLWNLSSGHLIRTLTNHTQPVLCMAISPDGQTLASGSADTTIKLWDLSTSQEICTLDEESGFVFAVGFHPSEQILISTHEDRTIKLWNLLTREVINTIPTSELVVSVAISPDGQTLAGGCGSSAIQVIGMWNLDTGKLISSFRGYDGSVDHRDIVYAVAFSPKGQMLASGSRDATIKLWGIPQPLKIE